MRKLLLFMDGSVTAALWTTGPFLLPSLLYYDNNVVMRRPCSVQEALAMTTGTGTTTATTTTMMLPNNNGTNTDPSPGVLEIMKPSSLSSSALSQTNDLNGGGANTMTSISSTTSAMAYVLLLFLIGKAMGSHVMDIKNRRRYPRLSLLIRSRMPLWCSSSSSSSSSSIPMAMTMTTTARDIDSMTPSSRRMACLAVATLVPLMLLNWGLGIYTLRGWMIVRFVTAFISGGIMTYYCGNGGGNSSNSTNSNSNIMIGYKEKKGEDGSDEDDGEEEEQQQWRMMEEGQSQSLPLLSTTTTSFTGEHDQGGFKSMTSMTSSSPQQQQLLEKKWLDWYWLAGVATSSLFGGYIFYPLNRLTAVALHHDGIYYHALVLLLVLLCLGGVVDRCLCGYYTKNNKPIDKFQKIPSNNDGDGDDDDRNSGGMAIVRRSNSSSTTRQRKQVVQRQQQQQQQQQQSQRRQHQQQQSTTTSTSYDEEQQTIPFYDHQMTTTGTTSTTTSPTPSPMMRHHHRQRSNSNDTFESEQFFDCLDDIELDSSDHNNNNISNDDVVAATTTTTTTTTASPVILPTTQKNYETQIAIYSKRRVLYSDGSPAFVPAGESQSTIPHGYLTLYKRKQRNNNNISSSSSSNNNNKVAQSKYQQTQQWRKLHQINSLHTIPHTWFPKIKVAYPHVVHGYTKNGMLVVYERPGKMNLKHLFRNGGATVEDMVFHYCYLMEYLSNLESVLTELHSNGDNDEDEDDDEWQEELAAYAHAKQLRLQTDPIPFGFCVVMDISGATPTSLSGDVMTYLKRAGEINSLHYPGSMRRAIAVQAPFWIGVVWKAMKGAMPESVTVDLFSGKQTMEEGGLERYIEEDQIPVEYGGKSKFVLGEHPFEVGLRRLVERQGRGEKEEVAATKDGLVVGSSGYDDEDNRLAIPHGQSGGGADDSSPLLQQHDSTPVYFSPTSLRLEKNVELNQQQGGSVNGSPAYSSADDQRTISTLREWDGLAPESVLAVTATLRFFVYIVVGSLELALPYWTISDPLHGGLGYEPHRTGMAVFASCFIISWANKRSRFVHLTRATIEKSSLRGFRIGIGTSCFALTCVGLIPITTSHPSKSLFGLLCFSAYLSLVVFGGTLGIISLEHIRDAVAMTSLEGGNNDALLGRIQNPKSTYYSTMPTLFGRSVGYVCIAPIFRWSIQKELSFPLNASFFLCLLACICWLLYIVSFSLHTASVSLAPPTSNSSRHTKRNKESQFTSAVSGWFSFAKEVWLVASADVGFLVNELSRKDSKRVSNRR